MERIQLNADFTLGEGTLSCGLPLLEMVWIPPGNAIIGSPADESGRSPSERQFEAVFKTGFWLSRYLVTRGQWNAVMTPEDQVERNQTDLPVGGIKWQKANEFCDLLNMSFGESLPEGYSFRLPTETQWEYSCRAETETRHYLGDTDRELSEIAWHKDNSGGEPQRVGLKQPNAWGLYDMLGNMSEWCEDYINDYPEGSATDWCSMKRQPCRVFRSASYGTPPDSSLFRCAARGYVEPDVTAAWFGLRVSVRRTG